MSVYRKNKVNLLDYPFQSDVHKRLLTTTLSPFEVELVVEILQGSLQTNPKKLAEYLDREVDELTDSLERLQELGLYTLQSGKIAVDKEMRKYYELQMMRFDPHFRPNLEFLRQLLTKVPIHHLPLWYSIPRNSDDIFLSIIEKFFHFPKQYQRYLEELECDEPYLVEVAHFIHSRETFEVPLEAIMSQFNLSRLKLEEVLVQLELQFVAFVHYRYEGDHLVEMVSPIQEWREYLEHTRQAVPLPSEKVGEVKRSHPHDFGFVIEMNKKLKEILKGGYTCCDGDKQYLEYLLHLQLVQRDGEGYKAKSSAKIWLEAALQEQAITLYRQLFAQGLNEPCVERNYRSIEKSLENVLQMGWVDFETYLRGCTASVGSNDFIALHKKGKRWFYQLPSYTDSDVAVIKEALFGPFTHAGILATGECGGRPCFSVTPFGRMTLS